MTEREQLLELIEDAVTDHGGDLGGWTKLGDGELRLFDGRATVHVDIADDEHTAPGVVHAHVVTTLPEHDDSELDACVFGIGDDKQSALAEVATLWMTSVAGPIRSFLDGRPVCMTCQAGVAGGQIDDGFAPGDYGLRGVRAFVGPTIQRGFDNTEALSDLDDTKPWFRYAVESASPRPLHLAKATILHGERGWERTLEIDGHDVSHHESSWPAGIEANGFGYAARFAVFEFAADSDELRRRAELDRAIERFAELYAHHQSVDELVDGMVDEGYSIDLVDEIEKVSTIAFGRAYFERAGIRYPETVVRARADGRIETVPTASLPAFSRARAIAGRLATTMPEDEFRALCLYNAESQVIVQYLGSTNEPELSKIKMYPSVVPDRGASDATIERALSNAMPPEKPQPPASFERPRRPRQKPKPWWKFW